MLYRWQIAGTSCVIWPTRLMGSCGVRHRSRSPREKPVGTRPRSVNQGLLTFVCHRPNTSDESTCTSGSGRWRRLYEQGRSLREIAGILEIDTKTLRYGCRTASHGPRLNLIGAASAGDANLAPYLPYLPSRSLGRMPKRSAALA